MTVTIKQRGNGDGHHQVATAKREGVSSGFPWITCIPLYIYRSKTQRGLGSGAVPSSDWVAIKDEGIIKFGVIESKQGLSAPLENII